MSQHAGRLVHPTRDSIDYYNGFSWPCLFFGVFWFAYKGLWVWALFSFVICWVTAGFAWLAFPFFANRIHADHLKSQGYRERSELDDLGFQRSSPPLASPADVLDAASGAASSWAGGTLSDTGPESLGDEFKPELEEEGGLDPTDSLRQITSMRQEGLITDEEFEVKKKELLDRL